jgi:3',5'-cyclic-AMP phosphodiesterase
MLIAQITDTHITAPGTLLMGIVDTASALAQAVAALNLLDPSPDLVVLTGDLVESGETGGV